MNSKYNILTSLSRPYHKYIGRPHTSIPSNLRANRRNLFDSGYPENSKIEFNANEVKFLGFTVNEHGASPIKPKVEAVENYP